MCLESQELSQVTEITSRGEPLFPKATNVNKPNLKEMKGKETRLNSQGQKTYNNSNNIIYIYIYIYA